MESQSTSSKTKALKPSTLRIGKRYRASRVEDQYDAIIIGSGIGGMTCGAMLSKAGQKVLVLEQHYTAGGYTHSYSRNGYEWDVGVHYVGEMGNPKSPMRRVFDFITEGELKWAPLDKNYDRFCFGDDVYNLHAGRKNFKKGLLEHFPDEEAALDKYLKMLDTVTNYFPLKIMDKLLPEVLANPYKIFKRYGLPKYFNQTTYEVLSGLTNNQKLIAVLTGQWGDNGLPPKQSAFLIHALIARHFLNGAYYPEGGAWKIAETIIPVVQQSGGDILTYAEVKRIVIEKGKAMGVEMSDGHIIRSPKIISSAGVVNTFEDLVPAELTKKHGYDKHLKKSTSSIAHLGMYIGLKGSVEEHKLPKTNYWIFPDYDADKSSEAFENDMNQPIPAVYIAFPAAKDPAWQRNNPDKCTIEIVAPCPYEWFEKWENEPWGKRGADYDALKEQFTQRLLSVLYEKFPQLEGKLDYYETSTPLSTNYFCAYKRGELYGLNHDPERFEQTWLRPQTRIPGLYLTGQDVLSCGVGSALMSGVMTSASVLGWRGYKLLDQFGLRKSASVGMPAEAR